MLSWLFSRSPGQRKASDLYGAVVALARTPALYADMGVADTPEGRYEALVLNLFLVMERLRAEGEAGVEASQALIERFVIDMDDNMREMGVGEHRPGHEQAPRHGHRGRDVEGLQRHATSMPKVALRRSGDRCHETRHPNPARSGDPDVS